MKENQQSNIFMFTQSGEQTKKYRHDYSMTEELKNELLGKVYLEFVKGAIYRHYNVFSDYTNEWISELEIQNDQQMQQVIELTFWWKIFYDANNDPDVNEIQFFYQENQHYFKKWPILKSWLDEWYNIKPKLYHIGDRFGLNANVAIDIQTSTPIDIFYPLPTITGPEKGTIVAGILLPFCDSLYFPICDFYEFNPKINHELASYIKHYFETISNDHCEYEQFIDLFMSLVKFENLSMQNQ